MIFAEPPDESVHDAPRLPVRRWLHRRQRGFVACSRALNPRWGRVGRCGCRSWRACPPWIRAKCNVSLGSGTPWELIMDEVLHFPGDGAGARRRSKDQGPLTVGNVRVVEHFPNGGRGRELAGRGGEVQAGEGESQRLSARLSRGHREWPSGARTSGMSTLTMPGDSRDPKVPWARTCSPGVS